MIHAVNRLLELMGVAYSLAIVRFAIHLGRLTLLDRRDRRRAARLIHPSQLAHLEAQLGDIDVAAIVREHQSKESP